MFYWNDYWGCIGEDEPELHEHSVWKEEWEDHDACIGDIDISLLNPDLF